MGDLPDTFVPGFHNENEIKKMKYRKFGNTGLRVSELSLGTATFSYFYRDYSLDLEECKAMVLEALKKGINYIDTAPYYGHGASEEILGKCLEGIPRKAYYIATKVGRYEKDPNLMFDFSAKKTRDSIKKSLERLKLDYVDVLQIHDVEFAPSLDIVLNETLPVLKEAKDQGKTRFIGVTGYHPSFLADLLKKSTISIDTVLCYSRLAILDQGLKEYIPFFESKKVALVNAAPHCQALLTNNGPPEWQASCKEIKDACRAAGNYCKENGVSLGKLALYYALQQDGPGTNLVGIGTREILGYNLDVVFNGVSKKEEDVLNYIIKNIFSKLTKTNWEQVEIENYKKSLKK